MDSPPLHLKRHLVACHDCDALQCQPDLAATATPAGAHCWRCGAVLVRRRSRRPEHMLPLVLAAAVLYLISNAAPLLVMSANGASNATTLWGATRALWQQNEGAISVVVFLTTIIIPAFELGAMVYILAGLRCLELGLIDRTPPLSRLLLRLLHVVQPWAMLEVFLLALLVSFFKLADLASVTPGYSLWAFGMVVLLTAAFTAAFDPQEVWPRLTEEEYRSWLAW